MPSLHCRAISGRSGTEAAGQCRGLPVPLSGCSSGKAEAEQRRGNAAGEQQQQLLWPRLPGPELGAVATKKVHFGFNLIQRINNYQLSQFGLTTIPSGKIPS